ncbi:hypothetical protein BJ741DRAFT_672548 [Chytriomyces cf. hyalinus JEL632]|nr:hypothetical protein BJ741DRAFT_672548 [Chytriomyces cf. hyalinus JEL632]
MADLPSNNGGTVFSHFPCFDDWSSQQENEAIIESYHDALHQHAEEIKFKRQYPEDAFAVFEYLAHLGHVAGMCSYGVSIMFSQGTAVDRTEGFSWVEKSATLGFPKAQRQLVTCLSRGNGCEQNGVEALRWAQAAIDQGFADVHSTVGTMYMDGYGVPVNHAKGIEHYFLGMDAGSVDCIGQVGYLYRDGTGVEKNIKKAVELYEKAISLGCGFGRYYLGDLYQAGDVGIPNDPTKAATYFKQALQLEDDPAPSMRCLALLLQSLTIHGLYTYLGFKYANGTGVEQDYTQAIEFYKRAAKQNHAPAKSNLGYLLGEGQGCVKDSVRAADLYQQAAALGDGNGAYNCGVVFQCGNGVAINLFKAIDYYRMAVRLKYDRAKSCLGPHSSISHDLYNTAHVLQKGKKDKEALDHFHAAAVQGYSTAVSSVASMYRNAAGLGPVSFEKQMRYFEPPEARDSTLSAMPNEILVQIFQWLHPKECILLRPTSRRIWTLLEDESVPRHLFKFRLQLVPSRHMTEQHWLDQMLFHGPRAFQAAYLEMNVNGLQIQMDKSYLHSLKQQRFGWCDPRQHQAFAQFNGVGAVAQSVRFDGTNIPTSIIELTHLEVLMLKECGLTGELGEELIQFLKTLRRYCLRNNRLYRLAHVRFKWSHDRNATNHQRHAPS